MALKARGKMDPAYQWKLSDIYPDAAAWEQEFAETQALVAGLGNLPGTLKTSREGLKAGLDRIYAAQQKVELLYTYANLYKSCDNGDAAAQRLEGKALNLYMEFSTALSFLDPEILSIPEETLNEWLEDPALAVYRHMLEDTTRMRPYTLPEEQERLLSQLGDVASTPDNVFTMLQSVDMVFPDVTGEDGKPAPLSHGNYGIYLRSANRDVRREAFETYHGEFQKYINTLAASYSGTVKMDTFYAKARGYESSLQQNLFVDNVPVSVYTSLVEAIHGGIPTMERYLELRKKALKLDDLHMYDLYTPMVDDVNFDIDFDACKTLVKKALEPLGARYQTLLDTAYADSWMDVYENKGKTTGAFSCGVHGVHPYVLLNFADSLEDAYTMAHELGHAMHSFFSSEANPYPTHDYRIFVAEVASTVNEVLLTKYFLRMETDKKRRAFILNHLLESFRTTVFRQTLFAEFEQKAHDLYMNGEPLTAEGLSDMYKKLNEQYYPGIVIDDLISAEWARIPHFYSAFYVYQYATGFCSAVSIADRIIETGDASDYLKFLTTGGSDYPINELKIAGIDLTGPEVVARALRVFDETITELSELMEEL